MRCLCLSSLTLFGLMAAACAQAQPVPPTGPKAERILVAEVEVRSGPSANFPATGKLKQGDSVQVKGDADSSPGWLEIVPPPGSISWVSDDALEPAAPSSNGKRIVKVKKADTPIRTGTVLGQPPVEPPVERCKVPAGTLVTVLGEKISLPHNENLWPIEPVANDSRYIPKSAIQPPPAPVVNATPTAKSNASASNSSDPPLWTQADQAMKEGRLDDATRLLQQLCQQARIENNEILADRCRTRLYEIQQMRSPAKLVSRPGGRTGFTPPDMNNPAPPPLAKPVSNSRTGLAAKKENQESAAGYLRRSGLEIERGKPTYALENRDGSLRMYVLAGSSVDLEPYVNRIVELQGVVQIRNDIRRGSLMTAARATLLK
ncbi:MAG TPA: hypothetical protein VGZ47_02515 [Gemmataceae bacterium]|nr:hypothetical protein [Gemmataceae bacterium]